MKELTYEEKVRRNYTKNVKRKDIKSMYQKRVKPIFKKCKCGRKVTDHHFLCNKCWKEKHLKEKEKGGNKK